MKSMAFLITVLSIVFFTSIIPAKAAQDAVVTKEQAVIREHPWADSAILETRSAGSKVRVSSGTKNGWFKIRLNETKFGWIWQGDLAVLAHAGEVQAAGLEIKDKTHEPRPKSSGPWLFIRAGGFLFGLIDSDLSRRLGLAGGAIYLTPGGFAELAFKLEDRLRLAVRGLTYRSTSNISFGGQPYNVTHSASMAMVGLDTDVSQGESIDVSVGLYAGLTFPTSVTVVDPIQSAPNSFYVTKNTYAIMLNFSVKHPFTKSLSGVVELGALYTGIPNGNVKDPFNGDGPFLDVNGNPSSIRIAHVGPVLGAGLQLAF